MWWWWLLVLWARCEWSSDGLPLVGQPLVGMGGVLLLVVLEMSKHELEAAMPGLLLMMGVVMVMGIVMGDGYGW